MRKEKIFGVTTSHFTKTQEERKKYILAYEGSNTESQYFSAIIQNRQILGMNPLIQFVPLLRSAMQETEGHPQRILALLEEHLEHYHTVKVFLDKLVDFCAETMQITTNSVYSRQMLKTDILDFFANKNLDLSAKIPNPNAVLREISAFLIERIDLLSQIDCLEAYIIEQEIVFYPDIDEVCLIVDRDLGNFSDQQYIDVSQKCIQKNYRLFVSNPTFEFWLLLHKNDVFSFDKNELLINARHGKKRYLEKILSALYHGYKKEDIHPERFIFEVRTAIKNEQSFCEDIVCLKDQLGSNVGCLMNELIATKPNETFSDPSPL